MKLAFVNATARWGGVKTWMLDFGAALAQRGHIVRVYGRQPEFVTAAADRVGHGETARFGADLNPAAVRRFVQIFRNEGTQAVVINVGKDLATAGVAARLLGIPVVQRVGLPDDIPLRLKTRLLHQWIRPAFLAPCRFIAEGFATSLPYLDGFTIHTVLNAKRPSTHTLTVHTPRRLVVTQQLFADKGHAVLLHALAQVLESGVRQGRCADFTLHIVGTGGEENALRRLSTELGLESRVTWHGFSTTVSEHLADSDIFLLASTEEGLPNTLLEAMSAGLLPISRDVGGVKEVFPEALKPWLLPYTADAANFAGVLETALTLPDAELLRLRQLVRDACTGEPGFEARVSELEHWLTALIEAHTKTT